MALILAVICVTVFTVQVSDAALMSEAGTSAGASVDTAPKYVFFFIGDGLGAAQRQAAEYFAQEKDNDPGYKLTMNKLPVFGINTTYASDSLVTDSSSAGTALACGYKTNNGMLAVLPDGTKVKSIIEAAEEKGIATGLITTTRVTHATPAVWAAHNVDRDAENEIAEDMIDSGVDFVAGGGYRHFVPKDWPWGKSKRTDSRNLLGEIADKYFVYTGNGSTKSFLEMKPQGEQKVWAVFSESHMPYEIDRINQGINVPTLAQMTRKGIEVLSNYPNGFFMMVEGGRIDHACHANDAAGSIYDTLAFDDSIKVAYDFYLKHPKETLILVVGDHETGGMGLGFANNYFLKLDELLDCKASIEDMLSAGPYAYKKGDDRNAYFKLMEEQMGLDHLTDAEKAEITKAMDLIDQEVPSDSSYGSYNQAAIAVAHVISERANLQWTTYAHSGTAIPLSAVGVGAEKFGGYKDNTEIGNTMAVLLGLKLGPIK
jgi:alkaline phosphatase